MQHTILTVHLLVTDALRSVCTAFRSTASRAGGEKHAQHTSKEIIFIRRAKKDCMISESADRFLPFEIIMKV